MNWRPIDEAPLYIRELAVEFYAVAGASRYRLCHDTQNVDGRLVLRTHVLWTGFAHDSPVTHWLDAPLPEAPL